MRSIGYVFGAFVIMPIIIIIINVFFFGVIKSRRSR